MGAIPVPLKGNVQKMQETYSTFKANPDDSYSPAPTVAIVPNLKALKEVMSGLFCRRIPSRPGEWALPLAALFSSANCKACQLVS